MKKIIIFLTAIFLFSSPSQLTALFESSEVKRIKQDIREEQKKAISAAYHRLENCIKFHRDCNISEQAQMTLNETGFMLAMGIMALGQALDEETIDLALLYDVKRDVADFSQQCAENLIKEASISKQEAHNISFFHHSLCTGGIKRSKNTDCDQIKARFQKIIDAKN